MDEAPSDSGCYWRPSRLFPFHAAHCRCPQSLTSFPVMSPQFRLTGLHPASVHSCYPLLGRCDCWHGLCLLTPRDSCQLPEWQNAGGLGAVQRRALGTHASLRALQRALRWAHSARQGAQSLSPLLSRHSSRAASLQQMSLFWEYAACLQAEMPAGHQAARLGRALARTCPVTRCGLS